LAVRPGAEVKEDEVSAWAGPGRTEGRSRDENGGREKTAVYDGWCPFLTAAVFERIQSTYVSALKRCNQSIISNNSTHIHFCKQNLYLSFQMFQVVSYLVAQYQHISNETGSFQPCSDITFNSDYFQHFPLIPKYFSSFYVISTFMSKDIWTHINLSILYFNIIQILKSISLYFNIQMCVSTIFQQYFNRYFNIFYIWYIIINTHLNLFISTFFSTYFNHILISTFHILTYLNAFLTPCFTDEILQLKRLLTW
jgi:hypothetical protein